MGMPPWAMIAGGLLGLDKLVLEPGANIYKTIQGVRQDINNSEDSSQWQRDFQGVQTNPENYSVDYSKYNDPTKAIESDKQVEAVRQKLLERKARPELQAMEEQYPQLVSYLRGQYTDVSPQGATVAAESEKPVDSSIGDNKVYVNAMGEGSSGPVGGFTLGQIDPPPSPPPQSQPVTPMSIPAAYSQQYTNPLLMKKALELRKRAEEENRLARVAQSVQSGNPVDSNLLASYMMGGDKTTTNLNAIRELAKQNDEISQRRGSQIWMNAVGKAKLGDSEGLNALYSAAQYGLKPDDIARTADTLGLVPKWETKEVGMGQGEAKKVVRFNPRTGAEGAMVGAPWMPASPKVNVNTYVKSYESERAKLAAKDVDAMMQEAKAARGKINSLNAIDKLMDGIHTGKLTPAGVTVAQYAKSIGLNIDPKLGSKEAARALMGQLALQARNPAGGEGMPGAMSDSDREFLVNTITPSLTQSAQGRKKLIGIMRTMANRKLNETRLAQSYIQQNGMLDDGYYRQLDSWSQKNPMFTKPSRNNNPGKQKRPPLSSFGGRK